MLLRTILEFFMVPFDTKGHLNPEVIFKIPYLFSEIGLKTAEMLKAVKP